MSTSCTPTSYTAICQIYIKDPDFESLKPSLKRSNPYFSNVSEKKAKFTHVAIYPNQETKIFFDTIVYDTANSSVPIKVSLHSHTIIHPKANFEDEEKIFPLDVYLSVALKFLKNENFSEKIRRESAVSLLEQGRDVSKMFPVTNHLNDEDLLRKLLYELCTQKYSSIIPSDRQRIKDWLYQQICTLEYLPAIPSKTNLENEVDIFPFEVYSSLALTFLRDEKLSEKLRREMAINTLELGLPFYAAENSPKRALIEEQNVSKGIYKKSIPP